MAAASYAAQLRDPDYGKHARQRAVRLLNLVDNMSWIIQFAATESRARAHVIAHPETWPTATSKTDFFLFRRWTTICGRQLQLSYDRATEGVVDDRRICPRCHEAFPDDTGAVLFEHNTPDMQARAANNHRIVEYLAQEGTPNP